jgi:hypothetical protein
MGVRITICLLLSGGFFSFGQTKISRQNPADYHIKWSVPGSTKVSDEQTLHFLSFQGAQYSFADGFLPRYYENVPVDLSSTGMSASLANASYETMTADEIALVKDPSAIGNQINIISNITYQRKKPVGVVTFIPIRKNPSTGRLEKLVSFDIEVVRSSQRSSSRSPVYAANSVLQSGKWYRISLTQDGIYKLDYAFLASLGIDMASLDPDNIRIYGNGGGMRPAANNVPYPDDLLEDAIVVNDGGDGAFNATDYVLFYGRGPNTWKASGLSCPGDVHVTNIYSDSAFYFINTDLGPGKRVSTQVSSTLPVTNTVNTFDEHAVHEVDAVNFIKSGSQWFGEYFDNIASYNFSFSCPNIDQTVPVSVNTQIASRYLISGSASATYASP